MPTTLNPTCPLCGLRYAGRPLLELHLREDHLQRDHAEPAPSDPGDAATPAAPARRSRRSRLGWARTALHRTVWALRYANQELMRAHEALAARERRVSGHGGDRVAGGGRA